LVALIVEVPQFAWLWMSNAITIFVMSPIVPPDDSFGGVAPVKLAAALSRTVAWSVMFTLTTPIESPVYSSAASSSDTFAVAVPESEALLGSLTVIVAL
jgi:hypothetical protein